MLSPLLSSIMWLLCRYWVPPVFFTLALAGCSTDFVSPEDPRCIIVVHPGEVAEITRWQIDNCEAVQVVVVVST